MSEMTRCEHSEQRRNKKKTKVQGLQILKYGLMFLFNGASRCARLCKKSCLNEK